MRGKGRPQCCIPIQLSARAGQRPFSASIQRPALPNIYTQPKRVLCSTPFSLFPRRRDFFSSNAALFKQPNASKIVKNSSPDENDNSTRKARRLPPGKNALRRVALAAERSKVGLVPNGSVLQKDSQLRSMRVTAYCIAERFDMFAITELVKAQGGEVDPYQTKLFPQVIHLQLPQYPDKQPTVVGSKSNPPDLGDVFVFPSGTIVTWSLSNKAAMQFIEDVLVPSAENPHLKEMETESLDYLEDQTRENSSIRGDTITIGSKIQPWPRHEAGSCNDNSSQKSDFQRRERADITFTKIAFSSGLARSTKLAVLETLLDDYFESTRSIPTLMSQGSRLPFTRSFILRKTGQLLNLRAQLNLYSELTDSLPDLFWDSRHDLGLEAYYDQVGWALDVGIRIKVLNSKMDYAQEIASVLRERLSEKHGLVLEWMIIALIAVEVGFEILRLWKEKKENSGVSTARSNG